MNSYINNYKKNLNFFFDNFDNQIIEDVKKIILENENKNIYLIGVGKSYNLALQTSDLFKSIGFKSFCLNADKLLHGDLGVLKNDIIFIISKSGNTKELLQIIPFINKVIISI